MPKPLLLGECHLDPAVIDFLDKNLDRLKIAGYSTICVEMPLDNRSKFDLPNSPSRQIAYKLLRLSDGDILSTSKEEFIMQIKAQIKAGVIKMDEANIESLAQSIKTLPVKNKWYEFADKAKSCGIKIMCIDNYELAIDDVEGKNILTREITMGTNLIKTIEGLKQTEGVIVAVGANHAFNLSNSLTLSGIENERHILKSPDPKSVNIPAETIMHLRKIGAISYSAEWEKAFFDKLLPNSSKFLHTTGTGKVSSMVARIFSRSKEGMPDDLSHEMKLQLDNAAKELANPNGRATY